MKPHITTVTLYHSAAIAFWHFADAVHWNEQMFNREFLASNLHAGKEKEPVFQNMPSGVASLGSGRISVDHHLEPCGRLWRC